MEYKVLIKLIVPEIEQEYELYIPVNRTIAVVANLLNKAVTEATNDIFPPKEIIHLTNRRTGTIYKPNEFVRNTDIRNGTELILY
jgi:hypothetical protein